MSDRASGFQQGNGGKDLRHKPRGGVSLKEWQYQRLHVVDVQAAAHKLKAGAPERATDIDRLAAVEGDPADRWNLEAAMRRLLDFAGEQGASLADCLELRKRLTGLHVVDVRALAEQLKKKAPRQWGKAIDRLATVQTPDRAGIEAALQRLSDFAGQHGDALRWCLGDEELRQRASAMAVETDRALTSIFVNHGVGREAGDAAALQDRLTRHDAFIHATAGKSAAQVRRETGRDLGLWAGSDAMTPEAVQEAQDMLNRLKNAADAGIAFLVEWCDSNQVELPKLPKRECGRTLGVVLGAINRARDKEWWVRQMRRAAARIVEAGNIKLGTVNRRAGGYCSDDGLQRRQQQQRRNANNLATTLMKNEAGQVFSLAELAAASVSNPVNRGGELMTRIRGCEEYADAVGHVGLFITLTCPSAMHPMLSKGWRIKAGGDDTAQAYRANRNPRYDGVTTPRDAQKWLTGQWAKVRATLARKGWHIYGFRVAEPHHDATPHWHALVWCQSEDEAAQVEGVIRRFWIDTDKRYSDEPGARDNRVNFKRLEKGGAAGYIAKYIAKSIGHHALAEHLDTAGATGDLFPVDMDGAPGHQRVDAWASIWGIRQFQAIGQPSVTVWREVRRVTEDQVRALGWGGGNTAAKLAWDAAQKIGAKQASWCDYLRALGGVCLRRLDYRLQPAKRVSRKSNKYGERLKVCKVVGVLLQSGQRLISRRQMWVPLEDGAEAVQARGRIVRGETPQDAAHRAACGTAWTGFNNCNARLTGGRPNWLWADAEARAKTQRSVEDDALMARYLARRYAETLQTFGATPEEARAGVRRVDDRARMAVDRVLLGSAPEREQLDRMSQDELKALGWSGRGQAAAAIEADTDEQLKGVAACMADEVADLLRRMGWSHAQAVNAMASDGWIVAPTRPAPAVKRTEAPAFDLDAAMDAVALRLGY